MKLLITDKEISKFLVELTDWKKELEKNNVIFKDDCLQTYLAELHPKMLEPRAKDKLLDKLRGSIERDLRNYFDDIHRNLILIRKKKFRMISRNFEYIFNKLNKKSVFKLYKKHKFQDFVKGAGLSIDRNSKISRRSDYTDYQEDCLFRNMEGNENMLLTKMQNNWPFWFIDTGYTNFLNGKKKTWHRLTRNHLHHYRPFYPPADRLGIFESFPLKWRQSGEKIMIIEPGSFSANTFNVDIKKWKYDIEKELRQYTDRPIVFREKLAKKKRKNLYRELCDEDYYCVININSNAAIESIWAGVPVITLSNHISNSVSRNKISDINDLYRPNIAEWLCMISYSQFTYEELIDGTAYQIVRDYHV